MVGFPGMRTFVFFLFFDAFFTFGLSRLNPDFWDRLKKKWFLGKFSFKLWCIASSTRRLAARPRKVNCQCSAVPCSSAGRRFAASRITTEKWVCFHKNEFDEILCKLSPAISFFDEMLELH